MKSLILFLAVSALHALPIPSADPDAALRFCTTRNNTYGELKSELLEKLKIVFKIGVFVESGTHLGHTTAVAANIFEEVHTVELSPDMCREAARRFAGQNHVTVYLGDSGQVFQTFLPKISSRILFYLDGHYSGGITAKGSNNTPIFQELAAIRNGKKSDSVIIIDDIRCFQDSCYPEKIKGTHLEGYPPLDQVISAILEINPCYQICFIGDALLAFTDPVSVSPVVHASTLHRLGSVYEIPDDQLLNADLTIKNIQGDELIEMILYYHIYAPFEIATGFRSFATLWLGLIEDNNSLIEEAARHSPPGWRAPQIAAKF